MKKLQLSYKPLGQFRCPYEGEWFRGNRGFPVLALFDFRETQFEILEEVITETEVLMSKSDGNPTEYIGDGVYTVFDGFGIWLCANDAVNPSDRVYLEPCVLKSLINFAKTHGVIE